MVHLDWQKKNAKISIPVAIIFTIAFGSLSLAQDKTPEKVKGDRKGAEVFKQYCSSCHLGGGNRVNDKKPVAGSTVLKSITTFQKYLEQPPGHMPHYESLVKDKATVKKLLEYCRTLKKSESA